MPRKKKNQPVVQEHKDIVETSLEDIMADRFNRYSKYIIQERALPDVRDGLKPVQRRILWAMTEDGNTYDHPYRKSAKTVGNVIGNYHPHGDTSVYDALVRLSQDWKIRIPLIDMQGNNGSIDDDPAAAMRYTEARLSHLADFLVEDIDKDTVEWAPNFSDEKLEPTVFPARYPNLLVNGITGIAAGYATNIPPHNFNEVLDGTIYRIQHPECSLDEMMEIIQGPDFPTGGIVMSLKGIRDAFETGRGKVIIRSKASIEQTKTIQQIVVTEIPYEVVKSALVKRIDEIRLDKKAEGIIDVRDESDRNGLRIVIDVRKEANAQMILNFLYKNTDLQISYSYNVVAIENRAPVLMGLLQILDAFIKHREEIIFRRSQYTYNQKAKRAHIVEGLIKAVSILDEIIALIRSSKNKADSKQKLQESFAFTEAQAEAIVMLQLYRLSNTDIEELRKEAAALRKELKKLKNLIDHHEARMEVMVEELQELKELFPTERRSLLQKEVEEIVIDQREMIAKEQVMVSISRDGYVKKVSMRSYTSSQNSPSGHKEGDQMIGSGQASTLDTLLFFTNQGKTGQIPVYKLDEAKWKDTGVHISSLIKCEPAEKVVAAWILDHPIHGVQFLLATRQGQMKRLDGEALPVPGRMNKTQTVMNVAAEDEMMHVLPLYDPEEEIVLASHLGYGQRMNVMQVPASAPRTKGVIGMNLLADDYLLAVDRANRQSLLLLGEDGALKRESLSDLPVNKRPSKGVRLFKTRKTNPVALKNAISVQDDSNLDYFSDKKNVLRVKDVSKSAPGTPFSSMKLEGDVVFDTPLNILKDGFWTNKQIPEQETLF